MSFARVVRNVFVRLNKVSPLTASLAHALLRPEDSVQTHVACWWIASKFEEVYADDCIAIVRKFPFVYNPVTLIALEREVLRRQDFVIPFRTRVRAVCDALPEDVDMEVVDVWLHVLLDTNMIEVLAPEDWVRILAQIARGTHVAPILQAVAYALLPDVAKKQLGLPLALTCRVEKKRGRPDTHCGTIEKVRRLSL